MKTEKEIMEEFEKKPQEKPEQFKETLYETAWKMAGPIDDVIKKLQTFRDENKGRIVEIFVEPLGSFDNEPTIMGLVLSKK